MRIESLEALTKRIDEAIEAISKDERYAESLEVLAKIREEISEKVLPDLSWAGYNE